MNNQHPLSPIALALASLLQSSFAMAQINDNLVMTASPIIEANTVDGFSSYSTRVAESQIKESGALDLAAALRMAPGVQISRYNEVGSYSGDQGGNVYIRGLGASRPGSEIKTYIEGVPVYMGLWNHPLMDLLPLNAMASVDVQKGPQNMVSGNNFAAIHLQTKRAAQEGVNMQAEASLGSNATQTLRAHLLGKQADVDYLLAMGKVSSDGARPNADGRLTNAMGRINKQLSNAWRMGASFLSVDNQVGDPGDNRFAVSITPVGPYSFSNGVGRNETQTRMLSAFVAHQHGDWKGDLKVYQSTGHNNLQNDANWGTFNSHFKMSGFRWCEEFVPWQGGQLVGGVDQENVSGSVSGPHVGAAVGTPFAFGTAGSAEVPTFRVTSAYAGMNHLFQLSEAWVLKPSAGVRIYDSNVYGSKAAPNAGVSLISEQVTLFANYAQALLYPGAETYTLTRAIPMAFAANNGWNQLSPTEDKHTEVGFKWQAAANTTVDVSVFQDEISKRYIWSGFYMGAIANPASGTWSNAFPTYRVSGSEAAIKHAISHDWMVFGGVTTLDSSLSNLPYAPKTAFSFGVNGQINGYRLALDGQRQSSMYSLTQDRGSFTPSKVDGLTVANARIARPVAALGKRGEVYLAINNLFDAKYQYNAGYPMTERNVRVGVIASF